MSDYLTAQAQIDQRVCNNKTYFKSKVLARQKGKRYGQHAYECPHCRGYHLTSLRADVVRRRR